MNQSPGLILEWAGSALNDGSIGSGNQDTIAERANLLRQLTLVQKMSPGTVAPIRMARPIYCCH